MKRFPFHFFCEPDTGANAGGSTTTDATAADAAGATNNAAATENADVTADVTADATAAVATTNATAAAAPTLTPEETAAKLRRLDELEAAETARAAQAETERVAGLSEIEREKARATAAETERDAEKQKLADEIAAGNKTRLRIAAEKAAKDQGFTLAEGALDDAIALGHFDSVTFNDQREPQGVGEAVKSMVEKKPHYVQRADAVNLSGDTAGRARGLDTTDKTVKRASRALTRGF